MSQYPPPPPQGYPPQYGQYPPQYGNVAPLPPPRPASVTAIAIIAIIFGSLSVLSMLCVLPQQFGAFEFGRPNPVRTEMRADHLLFGWTLGTYLLAMLLGIIELFGGIKSLSLRPSGRGALIFFGWARLIAGVLELVVGWVVIQPRSMAILHKAAAADQALAGMMAMMKYFQWFGLGFAVLLLIWPIALLIVMGRRQVMEAFARGGMDGAPMQPPPPYA